MHCGIERFELESCKPVIACSIPQGGCRQVLACIHSAGTEQAITGLQDSSSNVSTPQCTTASQESHNRCKWLCALHDVCSWNVLAGGTTLALCQASIRVKQALHVLSSTTTKTRQKQSHTSKRKTQPGTTDHAREVCRDNHIQHHSI